VSVPAPQLPVGVPGPRVTRRVPHGRPLTGPTRPPAPARTTAARPRTASPPQLRRRARRGPHPVFWVFSASVVIAMVVGVVALNAMLAQTAFALHATRAELATLTERHEVLVKQLATASSPDRLAGWATAQGMAEPSRVEILPVPGTPRPTRG
jgi:hypothetical protein